MAPEGLPDPLRIAVAVARILEGLGVPYVAVGSVASSVHGEPRSTDDVDFLADLRLAHARELGAAFGPDWYLSQDAVRTAIAQGATFNAIHLPTGVKVDFFVVGSDAFDAHRVKRGQAVPISGTEELRVDAAEGSVVRKLEWFRRGGETSDRQWRDVVGILRAQGKRLDRAELSSWAARVGVSDLLARAEQEAGT